MPQANVSMNVRAASNAVSVIDISGEITAFCEDVIRTAHLEASKGRIRTIVLNFDGLEYMNSGGIGLLVTLLIRAQRQKQQLIAYGLSDHYREIFSVTRLDEAIEIFASEDAALSAVGEE